MREDEIVGWHYRLSGHEFEQTLGDSEGQGSLVCCSPGVAKSRTPLNNKRTQRTQGQQPSEGHAADNIVFSCRDFTGI